MAAPLRFPPTGITARVRMADRFGRHTNTVITGKVTAIRRNEVMVGGQQLRKDRIAQWSRVADLPAVEVAA